MSRWLTAFPRFIGRGDSDLPSDDTPQEGIVLDAPLDTRQVLSMLPHRYPFLLVDKILELESGQRVVGVKNVTINEHFFVGHFPERPIMPGVLIVEMMAQVSGILMRTLGDHGDKLAFLASIEKARFRKPVVPGDVLVAEVSLLRARGTIAWVKAESRVDGALVCEAELSLALIPRDHGGIL